MTRVSLENEIMGEIARLASDQQRRVLEFARSLSEPARHGVPGAGLLRFARSIPPEDLDAMEAAIEEDCERVDPNGW